MISEVFLREVQTSDLPVLYQQQLDPEASRMAVFPSRDHDAFMAHWTKSMASETVILRTVVCQDMVVGSIVSWEQSGRRNIGYWLGKEYWGRGIASAALALFVQQVPIRPLYAHVAKSNLASIRVLQKCGFAIHSEDTFTGLEGEPAEEFLMVLETP